jgi:hypothetical protein
MTNSIDSSQYLSQYRSQIDDLERAAAASDPAGASSYDRGLEEQFTAVKRQLLGSGGAAADGSCCHHHEHHNHEHHQRGSDGAGSRPDSASQTPPAQSSVPDISGTGSLDRANLPPALRQYLPMIDAASRQTGVPADILAAQLWDESRGRSDATSTNPGNGETDVGLMQINPDTFAQLQREHPELRGRSSSDPATNIMAAGYLMSDLLKQYNGNVDDALRVYNSGSLDPSNPNIAPGNIGDPNYVHSVNQFIADLQTGAPLPG